METIRKYGKQPYNVCLLHGGPGAAGEMKPVALELSKNYGILELLQTKKTINGLIKELRKQILTIKNLPVILIGFSWGAWLGIIFTKEYPELVERLILISASAFENKFNENLLAVRLNRLNDTQRRKVKSLMSTIKSEVEDNDALKKLSQLLSIADSYEHEYTDNDEIRIDVNIFRKVWNEASKLRDTGELADYLNDIKCPVIAIHGEDDPHSIKGVEEPLSEKLSDFRMIKLEKCGHIPWKEKHAKMEFFRSLREELNQIENENVL